MTPTINLSPTQESVASHTTGALLVEASAGSGKTRVLTERIKRLTLLTKRKILGITFTNKASEEIKERLQADIDISEHLFVGTFHGFCEYVIRNHGSSMGYEEMPQIFSNTEDRLKLIETAILLTPSVKLIYEGYSEQKQRDKLKYDALEIISRIKREVILEEDLEDKVENRETILLYKKYQEIMASHNAIDFDDLLLITYQLFIYNPKIASLYRRNFEYICVDEAQDMNRAQYMLLKALTGDENKNVMLVGDPQQSIYGFNGSNSNFMTKYFVEDYSPKVIYLKENYRNSKAVLELANRVMPNSTDLKNVVTQGICEIREFKIDSEESEWIFSKIEELVSLKHNNEIEGEINYDKIAILARNKYILVPAEKILTDKNIPYYYKTSAEGLVFESQAVNILNLALQIKINPKDGLHRYQLFRMLGKKNLDTLSDIANSLPSDLNKDIIQVVLDVDLNGSDFKRKISLLKGKFENQENYRDIDENERVMMCNDLKELLNHWHIYSMKTENISLSAFRNAMALGQTNKNIEKHGIALSTVHTMKGQENDIVFLMGMNEGTFPDYRAKTRIEMEQEKNNFYVAITRAKRFLYITYPLQRMTPWGNPKSHQISSFLKYISQIGEYDIIKNEQG
jgi:DNA helicase-2/ATP-dependent DNA helicase PcrA